jgi:hypothetical protein
MMKIGLAKVKFKHHQVQRRTTRRGGYRRANTESREKIMMTLQKEFKTTPGQKAAKPKGNAGRRQAIITDHRALLRGGGLRLHRHL